MTTAARNLLRDQANEARTDVLRTDRVARLFLGFASEELLRIAFRSLLRSTDFALFTVDVDGLITSAEGGWYDKFIPAGEVVGGRLDRWPAWRAYRFAYDFLHAHPERRACTYTVDLGPPLGRYFVAVIRLPSGGYANLSVHVGEGSGHLGDLTELLHDQEAHHERESEEAP